VLPFFLQALFLSELTATPPISDAPTDGAARNVTFLVKTADLRLTALCIRLSRWMLQHTDATALQLHLRGDVDFHGL
jgi:hypothetical protein